MVVVAKSLAGTVSQHPMSFAHFLCGPLMSHLATVNNTDDGSEVIRDYLPPDFAEFADDELIEAVQEACEMACAAGDDYQAFEPLRVDAVFLQPQDLPQVKMRLLPSHGLRLLATELEPIAA
jgi:hypothetical protein